MTIDEMKKSQANRLKQTIAEKLEIAALHPSWADNPHNGDWSGITFLDLVREAVLEKDYDNIEMIKDHLLDNLTAWENWADFIKDIDYYVHEVTGQI